jgi:hypothetical protein
MAYKDGSWGFQDTLGEIIIRPKYERTLGFSHGLAAVKRYGKWGFINKQDVEVIQFQYEEVKSFSKNRIWVKNDSAWALINENNDTLTPFVYDQVSYFKEGMAYVEKENKWGYVDTLGNVKVDIEYSKAFEFSEGLAHACLTDSTCGYINRKGKEVIPFIYSTNYGGEFKCGIAEVRDKIKGDYFYGFINKKGKYIVPVKYETCYDYNMFYKGLGMLQLPNDEYYIDYQKLFYVDTEGEFYYE